MCAVSSPQIVGKLFYLLRQPQLVGCKAASWQCARIHPWIGLYQKGEQVTESISNARLGVPPSMARRWPQSKNFNYARYLVTKMDSSWGS